MPAMMHMSFRFSQSELAELDKLVLWERSKGPMLLPHMMPNRTSVLKALVSREMLRLDEEQEKIRQRLETVNLNARRTLANMDRGEETAKERKTRLQRERRAAKSAQAA